MIAKITHGKDFGDLLTYLLSERDRADVIDTNMAGRDRRELAEEFCRVEATARPDGRAQPVQHVSLSMQTSERISDQKMIAIAKVYLRRTGFDLNRHQYVIVRHGDRPYAHCHVAVSRRLRDTGRLLPIPHLERIENLKVCRGIERDMGLLPVSSNRGPRSVGARFHDRRGRPVRPRRPTKTRIRGAILWAARGGPTMTEFLERLQRRSVHVRPVAMASGEVIGISYRYGDVAVKGIRLGPECTWSGLQRHLRVQYDPRRDLLAVRRAAASAQAAGVTPHMARRSRRLTSAESMRERDRKRALARKRSRPPKRHAPRTPARPTRRPRRIPQPPRALLSLGGYALGRLLEKAQENMDPEEDEGRNRSR